MPSYLVLARKYRPAVFSDVIGQDHVTQTLSNSIISGRVAHAFLFCGIRGVGKTTVARILAKSLNCTGRSEKDPNPCNNCSSCKEINAGLSVDVQEIDGASNTSVDNIREINENIKYPPASSRYKIIIIDEVHMISINAFNALLKTLEEPPPHAKFIFATTESHKVPATINSRCQRFNFRVISTRDIIAGMASILAKEGIRYDEKALALMAREAQGSFRDALSLLDQVIAFTHDSVTADDVLNILGITGRESLSRLFSAVLDKNPASVLKVVHEVFQEGYDPEQFFMDMIQYIRNLTVLRTVPDAAEIEGMVDVPPGELEQMESLAAKTSPEELQNLFSMLINNETDIKRSANPWTALEMTALKMAYAPEIVNLSEIVRRINAEPLLTTPNKEIPRSKMPKNFSEDKNEPIFPPKKALEPKNTSERFTITGIVPVPTGTPDEVWSSLKRRILQSGDAILHSIMEHGNLIAYGPSLVEIGFNKDLYIKEFERLIAKPENRQVFDETFGNAKIKLLTLASRTSLETNKPYGHPDDNQTDLERALKNEALENSIIKSILNEFEGSSIEDIKILQSR